MTVAALLAVTLTGCGTVMNLREMTVPEPRDGEISVFEPGRHAAPKLVYGGVKLDAVAGRGWFEEAAHDPPKALLGLYVWGVDLPLCAIADTLTLPQTLSADFERSFNEFYFEQGASIRESETADPSQWRPQRERESNPHSAAGARPAANRLPSQARTESWSGPSIR